MDGRLDLGCQRPIRRLDEHSWLYRGINALIHDISQRFNYHSQGGTPPIISIDLNLDMDILLLDLGVGK